MGKGTNGGREKRKREREKGELLFQKKIYVGIDKLSKVGSFGMLG